MSKGMPCLNRFSSVDAGNGAAECYQTGDWRVPLEGAASRERRPRMSHVTRRRGRSGRPCDEPQHGRQGIMLRGSGLEWIFSAVLGLLAANAMCVSGCGINQNLSETQQERDLAARMAWV